MPPVNSYEEDSTRDLVGGASGLAITTVALGPGSMSIEDQLQDVNQRLRSRSVSPSMAEKAFELAPRSQSRPSSPGGSNQEEKELRARRLSLLRTSDSPTAVPLHFKKPPTSPNSSRRVSMASPAQSPSSPRPGHRRPNSVEFKNVREIRPLWLVERHSTSKLDVEPEGPLPSLPSSKTSSRSPSVENLREGFDDGEDAVTGFYMGSGDSAYSWGRKPVDLRISTDQLPAEEDDFLNSQQATPTAETYNNENKQFGPPPIKKEKPKYEFHSPSELLQDPTTYQSMVPELPESLDRLPSVAGSELSAKEAETKVEETPVVESAREVDVKDEDGLKEHKSGLSSFLAGAGFASVVDALVSAAVSDHEQAAKDVDEHETTSKELTEDDGIQEQAPISSKSASVGGFGNIVDAAVAAAVSEHASHDVIDAHRDQSMKADEDIAREHAHSPNTGFFAGVVDAAVAAAANKTHAEVSQPGLSRDIDLQEAAAQEQKAEEIPPVEEEPKITTEEASSGTSKKQKRKDKKKKKKSKDLDAAAEDNDEAETTTAAAPVVELDSSTQPEPVAEVEAERAAEPLNETLTVAEQQPVSEEVEVKENAPEISIDQPLAGEIQEVAEDETREIEAPTPNVETELSSEAVTASAENEQTTAGTNDQSPHVAAEPEDEGSSSVAATASKSSKKKKKNKKNSLSLSESTSGETSTAPPDEPQIDPSVAITEEPKSIDEVAEEKPVLEKSSTSTPSEILEVSPEDVVASEEKQQDKVEPEILESVEKSTADEGDFVMVEQDAQVTPGTEQNKSLDSPVDEWFDSAETAEVQPTELVEVAQDATDKEIQTPEVLQDTTTIAKPAETKQTEEEPVTTSSSKKKNKKKKKKGQSLSIDESASQETAQESSETVQPQPESAEAPSLETEVVQAVDSESQSRDFEDAVPETSESLPSEVEESATKTDDALASAVPEVEPTTEVSEAVVESEPAPEQTEEVVAQQTSDALIEPSSSETPQPEADTISPEQSIKDIEAAETTPIQEVFEEVPSTPSKSKKKKGKKGKRVSWAEGAELAVESEPETPTLEETGPTVPSEEPLPATEEETAVPTSAEPEASTVSEVEVPREVEADVPTPTETVDSAAPSSADADSALTSEPSSTAEVAEKEPSTESQPEQQLEDQPISLPSDSSQSNEAKELPEEEADQPEGASSKSKKKKDKKKDKKKKKAAEASALADEEPPQPLEPPVDDVVKDVVGDTVPEISEPVAATPAEQPVTEEQTAKVVPAETTESQTPGVSEPIESTRVEKPTTEQETTDIVPAGATEPAASETLEPTEPIPVDQSTAEEQTSAPLPEDAPEPSAPEATADEPKSTDIAQEEEEPQETSKSKKKKDKKKKKAAAAAAAAALTLEQESSEAPVTEETKETDEKTEDTVVEMSKPDDDKEVIVEEPVAQPQTLEEPVEKYMEGPVQEFVQEPISEPAQETVQDPLDEPVEESVQEPIPEPVAEAIEEAKPADLADDVPIQETSKSKKKKDKRKKKAAEALLQDEEPTLMEENADSTPATAAEAPEQTESATQEQQLSEEEKTQDAISSEIEEPQLDKVPAEEVKTPEVAADDEWPQETSKSKKKKDKKKKKAAAALSLDEEPTPSESVVEETEAKPTEAESSEPQEQPIADETTKESTEDLTAEPQIAELPTEDVKSTENAENDGWAHEISSKSKKKKDKKKKNAAEALPWDDEPQTPVEEEVAGPAESALHEAQDLPAMEEQNLEDVPRDKNGELESTEPPTEVEPTESQELPAQEEPKLDDAPNDKDVATETPAEDVDAVPVAAEDELAQEPSSKSKKKKDKKKKKAAEALPWDEEPTSSDKPIDEQPPVETEPSASQAQEDTIVDDKKPDDATEVPDAETQILETPAEETKQVDTPEDDSWSQEASKSKKKKDKKKRKSLQLEAAKEDSTPDVAAEETKDIPETTPTVESAPATEDVAAAADEQKEVDPSDLQSQEHPQEEPVPVQTENIEDEGSLSKSSKSKKKKNKKNKSKDEPMPWDEEPSVMTPNVQQETIADQPAVTEDVPNEESARDLEARQVVEPTEQEKQESEQPAEIITEGEELPVTTQAETSEPTVLPQLEVSRFPEDASVAVQPEESTKLDALHATEYVDPQSLADATETTDAVEQSLTNSPTPAIPEDATNDNEVSQAKSGKKSKKKKKRDSIPWDDEPAEQEPSIAPVAAEVGDEFALKDSQSEEKQSEPAPTEELQSQQESVTAESKDLDFVDANVEPQNEEAVTATTEPTRQLSAKEKRKEKKKQKRRTLDLADEPSPTVADDTPEVTVPVETPMPDEQQKDDEVAPDDFAPVGKKKGKKNKRQSVSWEEEVIQAVAEEEPKSNEIEQVTEESDSKIPTLSEDLDSGPSQTENELQETPVEVEGKETFQSSEETHTDQKEKDFDWTDNVVSPQVQSQTEESPFPVRSPISDERDDPDQSRPTTTTAAVNDSQSYETVIPEAVAEDQRPAAVQQDERPTELATTDAQPVDQEAEDIDWTASKSSKKNRKKKKQKSITTLPEESMIVEEESSSKTPGEQDDQPDIEPKAVDTEQPREIQEEPVVVEDSSLVTESVPLQSIDTEQPKDFQEEPAVVEDSPLDSDSVPLEIVDTVQPSEIQEKPAPVEEAPLVSEPALAMEANPEEEFKPAGSSKKKGKKNKKKANAWSFEELGEEAMGDQNTEQAPIQPPGDEVKEEIVAVDNDKTTVPEEAPLAPEAMREEVLDDTTTKDATMTPKELPEENSVPQEEPPESETAPISEPPSRKLSKKEKRKMKKGKKIDFEEEEPVAETVEKEPETVTSEQVPEVAEETVVSEPVIDDTTIIDEKPVETEPAVEEVPVTTEELQIADLKPAVSEAPITVEEQVADANPVDIEPIPKAVPITTEEQPTEIANTKIAEPVLEEPLTTIEEQRVADMVPAESIPEEAPITTEEQVAEKEVQIAPVQEEPITRKLSKKEKRKNKKRMTESWPEEEPLEASRDITPQPDVVEPVAAEEPKSLVGDIVVEESIGVEPEHAHVSLDPFDVPDAEDEGPNEPPADFVIDTDVTERDYEPKLDADASLRARQLEQEADLAVAASLFGESAEPEPEQVVSRQSSKKQKGKKDKKDKKNAQLEKEILKDTVHASQTETPPKEEFVQEERHDTKPSEPVEEISRSWPSVDFDNDMSRMYSRDNEHEPERPIKISAQESVSMIDDFRAKETPEESTRSISDNPVVDLEKESQQGHRSHSPSQKEDVDMIISATMAAAGFFPSTVTAPAEKIASRDEQSTSGTSRDLSDVYEHRDVFSDPHSKSSITTFDAPKGESKSNKLAEIFPGLERVKYRKPSPKSHEKQTANILAVEERSLPTATPVKSLKKTQSTHHLSSRELPVTVESTSKDRSSSLLFDSSPSTRLEPTPDTTRRTSSSPIRLQHQTSSGSLHRTQSIHGHHSKHDSGSLHRTKSIHGHHTGAARSWQLEDELTPTKRASSQSPQPLLRSDNLEGLSPPRTPLDPIKEHDGPRLPSPSPRLVMGEGPYKLERPDSRSSVRSSRSLRKANRSISGDLRAVAAASQAKEQQSNPDWPSADADQDAHKKGKAGRQDVRHLPQPLNQPDSFHDDLLHDNNHDVHDDFDRRHLENIPSSSSYDPVTDKGKRPVRGMSDVYVSSTTD